MPFGGPALKRNDGTRFCARVLEFPEAQRPDFVTGVITPLLSMMKVAAEGLRLRFRSMNILSFSANATR
jgi:hypothetical protein